MNYKGRHCYFLVYILAILYIEGFSFSCSGFKILQFWKTLVPKILLFIFVTDSIVLNRENNSIPKTKEKYNNESNTFYSITDTKKLCCLSISDFDVGSQAALRQVVLYLMITPADGRYTSGLKEAGRSLFATFTYRIR